MKGNAWSDTDVRKIRKKHCVQLKLERGFFLLSFQILNLAERPADFFKPALNVNFLGNAFYKALPICSSVVHVHAQVKFAKCLEKYSWMFYRYGDEFLHFIFKVLWTEFFNKHVLSYCSFPLWETGDILNICVYPIYQQMPC